MGKKMNKAALLLGVLLLSSCRIYAGEVSVWDERKQWVESLNSYPIEFFAQQPLLLKTEYITEQSRKVNQLLTAYTGYSMISTKVFRKDYYISDKVTAAMDGGLAGVSVPLMFKQGEELPIIGQTRIGDEDLVLVPTDLESFVILVRRDGTLYDTIGQIRNRQLVLLADYYLPTPDNFHFAPVTTTSTEQTEPETGFDLRYDGIKAGRMMFTYMDYSRSDGKSGSFEILDFPLKAGNYRINDIVIRVITANKEKIDYMILNG